MKRIGTCHYCKFSTWVDVATLTATDATILVCELCDRIRFASEEEMGERDRYRAIMRAIAFIGNAILFELRRRA